ncbi:PKD domain-containing protein [Conexibacter woesei]|uniref:PKD domain-containing protein n=1 Tax=Conexibacter woesei TaxID=191495 RepID=UPI0009DC32C3|nr:PKD domain-containing protein [Conexibacter woesei]
MLGVLVRKCAVTGAALMAIASVGASAAQADVVQRGAATRAAAVGSSFQLDNVAITAGSGRLLAVGVATTEGQQVSGVSYGGQALTLRAALDSGARTTSGAHAEVWTLSNPAVGTAAVTVTFAHNVSAVIGAVAYDGVDALNPVSGPAQESVGDASSNSASLVLNNTQADADFSVLALGNLSNLTQTPFLGPSTDTVTASSLWSATGGGTIFGAGATRSGNTGQNRAPNAGVNYHWNFADSAQHLPYAFLMAGLNKAAAAIAPTATTQAANGVTTGGATLNGTVTSDGGGTLSKRGFVVCAAPCTPALGSGGTTEVDASGTTTGAFSVAATGLAPNKSYDYRAFATNVSGTGYGTDVTFRTLSANHAPVASAGGPYTIGEGTAPALDASGSTDADNDALTYRWDLDGDGQYDDATGARPALTAAQAATFGMGDGPATHAVAVQVSDPSAATSTASVNVTVTNVAPTPSVSGVPTPGTEGRSWTLHVSGTDPSAADAAGLHYGVDTDDDGTYDFGGDTYAEGTTATDFTITPTDSGTQTFDVAVTDKDGGNTFISVDYDVDNVAPTATLSTGGPVDEGSSGTASFSDQADPSSADTAAGFRYAYDLDNDGRWDIGDGTYAGSTTSSSAAVPTTDDGTVTVRAAIIDQDGASNTYTKTLTVNNVAPDGTVANDGPVDEGTDAHVTVTRVTDPSSADSAAGIRYAYDVGDDGTWESGGDGRTYATATTATSLTVPTTDDGTTPVRVAIIDKDGGVTTHVTNVVATGVAPTATFGNDGPVDEGSTATVSLTAPADPSSADTTAGFHYAFDTNDDGTWDVGDGTYGGSGSEAALRIPETDSGRFFVRAAIIDKDGLTTTYRGAVTVNNVAPVATVAAPDSTPLNTDLSFTVGASDVSPDDQARSFTYHVDWGDGTAPLRQNGHVPMIALHRYTTPGTYTVTVTAADKDGAVSAPVTVSVTIPAPPPPATTTTTDTTTTTTTTTTTPPAPVTGAGAVTPLLAKVQSLTVSPRCVAAAAATSRAVRIRYRLSTAATVRVTLQRSTGSHAVARCPPLRGSQQDDGRYKPGEYAPVSVRQTTGTAGAGGTSLTIAKAAKGGAVASVATVRPQALIAKGGRLAPGTYLLTVTTLSADGRVQDTARVKFWVLKAKTKATKKKAKA